MSSRSASKHDHCTDTYSICINTGCSITITNCLNDFKEPPTKGNYGTMKTIDGTSQITAFGIINWQVYDEDGKFKSSKCRLTTFHLWINDYSPLNTMVAFMDGQSRMKTCLVAITLMSGCSLWNLSPRSVLALKPQFLLSICSHILLATRRLISSPNSLLLTRLTVGAPPHVIAAPPLQLPLILHSTWKFSQKPMRI